jgi:predicted metal-dependent hydrolase
MDYLEIGNTKVEYDLVSSNRRKTIELVIDFNKGFTVRAPKGMKKEDIIKNLHRKEKWIINNLDKMTEILKYDSIKEFVSGEKFLLRGRRYALKVSKSKKELPSLEFKKSQFKAIVPSQFSETQYESLLRPLFIKFYKDRAEMIIRGRVNKYLKYFNKEPKKIIIAELNNKWGSCSKNNQMRFNWRIVLAKTSIIDYVVVHELCHMIQKNHSDKYWKELKRILPEYEKQKEWLRENSELLQL